MGDQTGLKGSRGSDSGAFSGNSLLFINILVGVSLGNAITPPRLREYHRRGGEHATNKTSSRHDSATGLMNL